jgi:arylformamidase
MHAAGMYDLHPVSLSARKKNVAFTAQSVAALSPIRHVDLIGAEVVVAVGTRESPEFQRQAREFAGALAAAGRNSRLLVARGLNHYEILLDLGSPDGEVRRALSELIGRA